MNAHHHELYSHAIGASGSVAAYGHYGRPVLAFPSEGGKAYNWQDNGIRGDPDGGVSYRQSAIEVALWVDRHGIDAAVSRTQVSG